ncbi:thiol reductant ABC exporter subunit CydC [Rhodovulum adriaticum]|uniref:ATP-binding cassette subfamily C protein CydC n=1 Tax=Rhodovulum adriaticum TaxID=35804 RepID=A0A4R2NKH7_RHOAD|nr:thiol reductant ABC exporter subunit CydC [Rhodovulum adriaticum]MBK1635501.1 thiol reductant ABC exporter subunit CydC [Rhodovulum adriaticum]TCP22073.1 ATP-binding cassette subfamily C protein CydC [Rhodovulum adriaticum]
MKDILHILRLIWRKQRTSLIRGTALAVAVVAMGVALLGLSGWFITAAGAAGLAGIGIAFNVFQPSAGVRLLALGRTAARYGERLLTHDATLKSLTDIRVGLLRGVLALPFQTLSRLRGAETMNRLVADVDALDGIALRLFIPAVAAVVVYVATFALLAWLTDPILAAWIVLSFTVGVGIVLAWTARHAKAPSRRAEKALQAFRIRVIDLLRVRDDLVVYGRLPDQAAAVDTAETRMRENLDATDRLERRAGLLLALTATISAGTALWLGSALAARGTITPAQAALGFFATLALTETVQPLRRGLADLGRMLDAARRVRRLLPEDEGQPVPAQPHAAPRPVPTAPALDLAHILYRHPGAERPVLDDFTLSVAPGETVALAGASGRGKSTALGLAAGLIRPDAGQVLLGGRPLSDIPEPALRAEITYLPQRSALLGHSFFEMLALADPSLTEDRALTVLEAVALSSTVAGRGGLHAPLSENGAGLSGGEQRRLAVARALVRRPRVLLLDEPTEGLDRPTAQRVLAGIRETLPKAAILTASHRKAEQDWADRLIRMR